MKKRGSIQCTLFVYLMTALFFIACDKNNEKLSESFPVIVSNDGKFSGRLKHGKEIETGDVDQDSWFVGKAVTNEVDKINVTHYENPTEKFYLGSSEINNGVFTLNLKDPPKEIFRSISEFINQGEEDLSISEPNAKMYDYLYPYVYKKDSYIGTIRLASGVNSSVYYNIIYVDRDTSITGTYSYFMYYNTEYKVYFKKGWNVVATSKVFDKESNIKTYMIKTINDFHELDWILLLN